MGTNSINLTNGYVTTSSYDYVTNTFKIKEEEDNKLTVKKVIYNDPATIVYFSDGSREVVKRCPEDEYDEQTGLLMCVAKKFLGKDDFHKMLKKYVKDY